MRTGTDCPVCGTPDATAIFAMDSVPVNSVVLVHDEASAREFPTGQIELVACDRCGFAWNAAFDLDLVSYGEGYEATQAFSATFNSFHDRLALDMVERFGLEGRTVIEIGCGQGEFLNLLRQRGVASGTGFDPAFDPDRPDGDLVDEVEVIADVYDERYQDRSADFVICKMTLEHIPEVVNFLRTVRRSLDGSPDAPVVFQIPNLEKILDDTAFWDVYYEHCSYFSPSSLTYAFLEAGFSATRTWTDYDGQYLFIEALPTDRSDSLPPRDAALAERLDRFAQQADKAVADWSEMLERWADEAAKVVLWGGGSKAVAFLSALGIEPAKDQGATSIAAAVDVNPYKWDTFLPGSGLPVVSPESLVDDPPDHVIVMNPIYSEEISSNLSDLGISAAVHPIDRVPSPARP